LEGTVLLLRGELCREPLTPKSFTYFEMPEHRRIVAALEAARPAAIIAATGRCPDLAGSLYPFPLINDGEFDIPNAFLTDEEGERLAAHAGAYADLTLRSRRIAAQAQHVVARARGKGPGRVVVFGHVDSWDGAPGALDNATGTAALLGLAHLLAGYEGRLAVELVPLNGEDYYGATGEKRFERDNEGRWDDIVLGMNVDAAGWRGHRTEVSLFDLDAEAERVVRAAVAARPGFAIGEPWYQSDHGLFLLHGRPALAVISEGYAELAATVTHTSADRLELADPAIVAEISAFFADVIGRL
jgi:aminopeptidase YwaD